MAKPPLPQRVTLLGQALHPTLHKLDAALELPLVPTAYQLDFASRLPAYLHTLEADSRRLMACVNAFMPEVIDNAAASNHEVYLTAARFQLALDKLLADYQTLRQAKAYGTEAKLPGLLAGAYRHLLREVRFWLKDVVDVIDDPLFAVQWRGLPTTGYVELPLALTLTPAPELAKLSQWARQMPLTPPRPRRQKPARQSLGFWGTVFAVVLGWSIADKLFGDDDCDQ